MEVELETTDVDWEDDVGQWLVHMDKIDDYLIETLGTDAEELEALED